MKNQDKSEGALGLPIKPDRRTLWLIIPVLMAIILILNLTAPTQQNNPTLAMHARWLPSDGQSVVSLIVADPAPWKAWFAQDYPSALIEERTSAHFSAIRVRGSSDWMGTQWPMPAHALAVDGDISLAQWEHAISQLQGHPGPYPRQQADFILTTLANRLATTQDPQAQFEPQRLRLIEQLLAAMSARDSRLALLETMAAEDLPLDWHEQQAQRLSTLTFEDLRPWLKP